MTVNTDSSVGLKGSIYNQVTVFGSGEDTNVPVKNMTDTLGNANEKDQPLSESRRSSRTLGDSPSQYEGNSHNHDTGHNTKQENTFCTYCKRYRPNENIEASVTPQEKPTDTTSQIVDWHGPQDPQKPMNWSPVRKLMIVVTTAPVTFTVSLGSSIFSATVEQTGAEFGVSSEIMLLGISLYVLGFAFGPVVWGPASELYGRTLPLWCGMFAFCIFQIPLGVAQNLQTIFVARFFQGFFGSAPLAITSGMYADFLPPVERGIAVSAYAAAVFCGPSLGPILGSYITESYLGWRWTAWITMISGAVFSILCCCVTPETYGPTILRRKATKLRFETQDFALHAKCEEMPNHASVFVTKYLTKPVRMLIAEPILLILTVYCSLVYGILYLTFEVYPIAFVSVRGWSATTGSLPFLALLVGIMLGGGIIAYNSVMHVGRRFKATQKLNPEDRLPPMILGSILLPIGLFWFAWTSNPSVPWPAQVFSGIFIGSGIMLVFMPALVYLVDVYLTAASSAVAINTMLRSAVAAGFPLFATCMFEGLGVDWGASVLGFVCLALTPFPLVFWRYGRKIRSWSKFAVLPDSK